jgi:hypothetical protein
MDSLLNLVHTPSMPSSRPCASGMAIPAPMSMPLIAGKAGKEARTRAGRRPTQVGMAPTNEPVGFGLTPVVA